MTKKLFVKSFGKKDRLVIDGEVYKMADIEDEDQRIGKIRVEFLDTISSESNNDNDSSDITKVVTSNGFNFLGSVTKESNNDSSDITKVVASNGFDFL